MAIDRAQMHDYAKRYGQLVARAWVDPAFKARLLAGRDGLSLGGR
jgi:hypothetical protein